MNADFAHAMTHLVPDSLRRNWTDAKLERKQYSCSTFMLYLGVDGAYPEMPHHTIQISSRYRGDLSQIEDSKTLPTDPSFYIQNACVSDDTLAPQGQSTIYLLAPVPHKTGNIDWNRDAAGFRELLLSKAEQAGFKDLRSRVRYEKMVTPETWERDFLIHKGATFIFGAQPLPDVAFQAAKPFRGHRRDVPRGRWNASRKRAPSYL
jgi:phytoene desaturase